MPDCFFRSEVGVRASPTVMLRREWMGIKGVRGRKGRKLTFTDLLLLKTNDHELGLNHPGLPSYSLDVSSPTHVSLGYSQVSAGLCSEALWKTHFFVLFLLLEASHTAWLQGPASSFKASSVVPHCPSQTILPQSHSHISLTFYPPSSSPFKDPCESIGPTQVIQDNRLNFF